MSAKTYGFILTSTWLLALVAVISAAQAFLS